MSHENLKDMATESLRNLAKQKLDLFSYEELRQFIMGDNTSNSLIKKADDYTFDELRTQLDYKVMAYNNAHLGIKEHGGDLYKRCIVTLMNHPVAPREIEIKLSWCVPSGYGDGNMVEKFSNESYVLTEEDIHEIKRRGSARDFLKTKLSILDVLDRKDQKPYTLPRSPIGKRNEKVN